MPEIRLIDANAVFQKLQSEIERTSRQSYYSTGICDGLGFAGALIETEPTVDAVPVKCGHWIRKAIFYVCSECGIKLIDDDFEQIAIFPKGYMPFCPNCTAKMEGVKNGNQV